jgi:hypothetical protein
VHEVAFLSSIGLAALAPQLAVAQEIGHYYGLGRQSQQAHELQRQMCEGGVQEQSMKPWMGCAGWQKDTRHASSR